MYTQPTVLDTDFGPTEIYKKSSCYRLRQMLVPLKEKCSSCYRLRLSECLLFGLDDDIKTENVFDFFASTDKAVYKCKTEKQLPNMDIFRTKKKKKNYTDTK